MTVVGEKGLILHYFNFDVVQTRYLMQINLGAGANGDTKNSDGKTSAQADVSEPYKTVCTLGKIVLVYLES